MATAADAVLNRVQPMLPAGHSRIGRQAVLEEKVIYILKKLGLHSS